MFQLPNQLILMDDFLNHGKNRKSTLIQVKQLYIILIYIYWLFLI